MLRINAWPRAKIAVAVIDFSRASAADVVPMSTDPSVRLVDSPVWTHGMAVPSSNLAEHWQEALHPALDSALVDQEATLGQPFAHLRVTEAIAHVPADGQGDDLVRKGRPENAELERRVKHRPQRLHRKRCPPS